MSMRPAVSCALAATLWSSLPVALSAQTRVGAEFEVNTYTPMYQSLPSVSADNAGAFVVVWESSEDEDGDSSGIFAQRFSAAGARVGLEFRVNSYTPGSQTRAAVASDADGDFVIAWQSLGQDGDSLGVFARRFGSAGAPLAIELQVSSYTTNAQNFPDVALDADGDFMIVWTSFGQDGDAYGIFARRFNSSGSPLAAEFKVNTVNAGSQTYPSVAASSSNGFVVVWQSSGEDGGGNGIFARRFDNTGNGGAVFAANFYTPRDQESPAVAMDGPGNFVVTWQGANQIDFDVYARRFDSQGTASGVEFRVNTFDVGDQRSPSVDLDGNGDFVVAWESYDQDGDYNGIFARTFDRFGVAEGVEFLVNTHTTSEQLLSDVALADNGQMVVTWQTLHAGSGVDIFAQRVAAPAILDIDGNGQIGPLTDGLLVLRFMFGFSGTTLTGGAVGPGCTRCNAAAIEPYLAGLV